MSGNSISSSVWLEVVRDQAEDVGGRHEMEGLGIYAKASESHLRGRGEMSR